MARSSAQILDDDEELDIATFMLDACGIDYSNFFQDERILTRENLEKNFKFLRKMIGNRSSRRAPYFVFGYFILVTGAKMPEDLRHKILDNTKWEDEESNWIIQNNRIMRKIYLNDFSEKVRKHKPGQKLHPIRLIYLNGKNDLYTKYRANTIIGINEFNKACKDGRIYKAKHINLQGWGLNKIPNEIFEIKDLETLCLDYNHLKEIPDEISNLVSLKILFLSYNDLKYFPKSITKLPTLEILSLDNNYISLVPESINELRSLQTLYIKKNKIKKIPDNIETGELKLLYRS